MFLLMGLQSQETEKKEKQLITVEIQTSAVCGMCKEKLEHDLAFEKGVKYVNLDNETKIITIKFKEGKNTKEIFQALKELSSNKINRFKQLKKYFCTIKAMTANRKIVIIVKMKLNNNLFFVLFLLFFMGV